MRKGRGMGKLAAIPSSEVKGYSRLMRETESFTYFSPALRRAVSSLSVCAGSL